MLILFVVPLNCQGGGGGHFFNSDLFFGDDLHLQIMQAFLQKHL